MGGVCECVCLLGGRSEEGGGRGCDRLLFGKTFFQPLVLVWENLFVPCPLQEPFYPLITINPFITARAL